MLSVGKTFTFDAAHFISGHKTCGQMHGHTWTLSVKLQDCKIQPNGMVIDFKVLGGLVKDQLRRYDHKILNDVVNFEPVTAETLVQHLCKIIHQSLVVITPEISYRFIICRLQEGNGGWAECVLEV